MARLLELHYHFEFKWVHKKRRSARLHLLFIIYYIHFALMPYQQMDNGQIEIMLRGIANCKDICLEEIVVHKIK